MVAGTAAACAPALAQSNTTAEARADRLVLDVDAHTLTLYRGQTRLDTYSVGLGSAGVGKRKRGDQRTPLGTYRLFRGRPSKFHRFLPVSYPNATDAARGLQSGLLTRAQHDAIVDATRRGRMPPQNTALGGAIGIHGLGRSFAMLPRSLQGLHRLFDGTAGCVLVTDDEVDRLAQSYVDGAALVIR